MQAGRWQTISTSAANDFRGTLAQDAAATLNLNVSSSGLPTNAECVVRAVRVLSVENLAWEIRLYRTRAFNAPTPDADRFAGRWTFVAGDGTRIGSSGLYEYYIDGNDIAYGDEDQQSELHLALVNRSAAGKSAGDTGAVRIELVVQEAAGGR